MAGGASSSSSRLSGPLNRGNHDVFISFRGEDTRTKFTCHLYKALDGKKIKAFMDYELHKGDEISQSLLRAIEESYVSVVVFSENYASSKWCLEELVKIMECRRDHEQDVIPVFYEIDPSHVRYQIGSYKAAFEKHEKNCRVEMNKVQKWKGALTEAANLAGCHSHSRSYRDDAELIQEIVNDVLKMLDRHYRPSDSKGLVGISRNFTELDLILKKSRSVGIWGMGGIGKTTIAQYIFDKCSRQYEGSYLLKNVREKSGESGRVPENLRDQLYLALLKGKLSTLNEVRLRRQRNLIVLDDVSSSQQVEDLVGELRPFGSESPDSRIIITTRDRSVLERAGVEHIYRMKELDNGESLKLFCLKAFNKEPPKSEDEEYSQKAIVYCKGIPLALEVLGSFLCPKSKTEWDSELEKLEKIPNKEIQNVLRLSYVGLSEVEKEIFLDIACFFKDEKEEHVIDVFDSCGFFSKSSMGSLRDKSLINISSGFVWMHDLIQKMGREIVQQESINNPGMRSRLWDFDDICDVLKNNKGTVAIQGIKLDMSQSKQNLRSSSDAFKKMSSLKYLSNMSGCLELPNGLESLPNELRYIKWHGYPLQSLPSNFCAEKLVTLMMFHGQFERLWDGVQNLVNLKKVKLVGCGKLMEFPDFSQAQKLKIVNLCGCGSLRYVHPSIFSLGMLEKLCLDNCGMLRALESEIPLRSLNCLSVSGCRSLREFSVSAEEVEDLSLSNSGIKVLDSSIGLFKKIKAIDLSGLELKNLPNELFCLKSLEKLKLSGCEIVSKQHLHLIFDGLQSLLELYLDECRGFHEFPDNLFRLSSLTVLVLDKSNVEKLPRSIKSLSTLKKLSLRSCKFLQFVPELLLSNCHLDTAHCPMLQGLSPKLFNSTLQEKYVSFQNCLNLDQENSLHQYLSERVQSLNLDHEKSYCFNLDMEHSLHQYLSEQVQNGLNLDHENSYCLNLDQVNSFLQHLSEQVQNGLNLGQLNSLHQYLSEQVQNGFNFDQEDSLDQYLSEQVQNDLNLDQENPLYQYLSERVQNGLDLYHNSYRLEFVSFIEGRKTYQLIIRQQRLKSPSLIAYPGHKVPKWFTYQSKGASITFTLAPPSDHYLGLLLCAVRSPPTSPSLSRPINIRWKCYLEDGGKQHSIDGIVSEQGIWRETGWYRVCISYISGRILEKINACRTKNPTASNSYNPKVTFEFYDDWVPKQQLIKKCGVYIVNASNYQTNEVVAGHGTKSIPELEYTERGSSSGQGPPHLKRRKSL